MKWPFAPIKSYGRLQPREKSALIVGAGVVLLMSIVVVLEPQWQSYKNMQADLSTRKMDLEWFRNQVPVINNLRNNCSFRIEKSMTTSDVLTLLIRRHQLKLERLNFDEELVSLTVTSNNANDILRVLEQIACEKFVLTQLNIRRISKPGKALDFQADMSFRRAM